MLGVWMGIRRRFLEQQASSLVRGTSSALALLLLSAGSGCGNPEQTAAIFAQKDRKSEAATIDRPGLLQAYPRGAETVAGHWNTTMPERRASFQPVSTEIAPEEREKAVMAVSAADHAVAKVSASLPAAREAADDPVANLRSLEESIVANNSALVGQAPRSIVVEALPAPLQPAPALSSRSALALPEPLVSKTTQRLAKSPIESANAADAVGKKTSIAAAEEHCEAKEAPFPIAMVKASKAERVSPLMSHTGESREVNEDHRECARPAIVELSPPRRDLASHLHDRLDLKETSVSTPAESAQTSTTVTRHRANTVLEQADKSVRPLFAFPKNDATTLGPDRDGLQQKTYKAPREPQEQVFAERTSLSPNPKATALAAPALPAPSFGGTPVNGTLGQLEKVGDKTGAQRFDRTLDPRVDMAQIATNGRTAYMAQLSSELSQSRLAVRQGINIIGEIQFDMIEGRMAVNVGQVLELFEPHLGQMLYADLRNSRSAGEFVTLERLAANGISLTYDAVYDELVLSPDAG